MKEYYHRLTRKLFSPVDAASLGMFRILFGALMFWQALYYLQKGHYLQFYVRPQFHFPYDFFHFIGPISPEFLQALFWLMAVAGLGMMVGLFYRFWAVVYFLAFTYCFLLDKAYYNNHYYFIILLSFLMIWVGAQRWGSLDQKFRPKPALIPYWNLFILRVQVLIVYFYGGLAKLNWDWFAGEPMRGWLKNVSTLPVVGPLLVTDWAPYFFSWGGIAFDLSIGFLLWWRKTRVIAFLAVLFFNLTNSVLFHIGVFPFLMIGAATLFDEPDWPRKFFKFKGALPKKFSFPVRSGVVAFLGAYLIVQIIVPFRHWLIPGDVSWTEEGHLFSWRMKLRDKQGKIKIQMTDPVTNKTVEVNPRDDLNRFQMKKMTQRPQFIYRYVQYLKEKFQGQGIANPVIKVDSQVSLNGRPFQPLIDPNVDLTQAKLTFFSHDNWILPLRENIKPGTLEVPGLINEEDTELIDGEPDLKNP